MPLESHAWETSSKSSWDVKRPKGPADHGIAFLIQRIGESHARSDVVLTVRNLAGECNIRVADGWLREDLQVIPRSVVQRQARGCAELILKEKRRGRRGKSGCALPERLQIIIIVAAGNIGQREKEEIGALGAVHKIITLVADVDISSGFQGVFPENLCEGVGDLVPPVGLGK